MNASFVFSLFAAAAICLIGVEGFDQSLRGSQALFSKTLLSSTCSRPFNRIFPTSTEPPSRSLRRSCFTLRGAGNGGSGGGGGGRGGGGDDGGSGGNGGSGSWKNILAAAGRDISSLPSDLVKALQDGRATADVLSKFFKLEKMAFLRPFLSIKAFRDRLLADDGFMNKVAIELIIGGAAQVIAEKQNRGDSFFKEFDYVIAGVATCLLANFAAVYLSAPTIVAKQAAAGGNALTKFLEACPDNAFQKVMSGSSAYSISQRIGAIVKPMPTLFTVGFVAGAGGYIYTALQVAVRKLLNPEATGGADIQPVKIAQISAVVGAYLAISSNLRYQLVAGVIEQRFLDVVLAKYMSARTLGSALVRTGNTYIGSYFMVFCIRVLGLQEMSE